MRHLIDPLDFTRQETDRLLSLAEEIIARPAEYAHACDGKILATLFYEPSTRTRHHPHDLRLRGHRRHAPL